MGMPSVRSNSTPQIPPLASLGRDDRGMVHPRAEGARETAGLGGWD
ncbi:MAG: hypothetical protein IFK92_16345 [Acidobacteria bacterium]|nr:hypothetical protein [Candidatus Sulfomarinibacter kjeldsenii]